jgi:CheY-like chemotaxis protein
MFVKGPILIIDDDADDRDLCVESLRTIGCPNQLHTFTDGTDALDFLNTTKENPFLILCDIRMNRMSGIELRQEIERSERLKKKSIPFVFITGSAEPQDVDKAYNLSVQGFFVKPNDFDDWQNILQRIVNYWSSCLEPNNMNQ